MNDHVVHPSCIMGPYDFRKGLTTTLITDYWRGRDKAAMAGGFDLIDEREVVEEIIDYEQKGTP